MLTLVQPSNDLRDAGASIPVACMQLCVHNATIFEGIAVKFSIPSLLFLSNNSGRLVV
jgi:hypothetical protein